jgi:hypothetical protein
MRSHLNHRLGKSCFHTFDTNLEVINEVPMQVIYLSSASLGHSQSVSKLDTAIA